jgi:sugar/nucleoside kinase (ribokinase family)
MRLLSIAHDPAALTRLEIEAAAHRLLDLGVGTALPSLIRGAVVLRSAELGAYVATQPHADTERNEAAPYAGRWVDAYWSAEHAERVVDVTGAGNTLLGGLAAGLALANDVYEGALAVPLSRRWRG